MFKVFFLVCAITILSLIDVTQGFTVTNGVSLANKSNMMNKSRISNRLYANEVDDETSSESSEVTKKSLEDKMKEWEATDEEMKAASLGGMVPAKNDGFDLGLLIAFPFIVGSALLFAVFPFIMDKIDVSSVGPPPTV
jgi:hypothetical protein